MPHAALLWWGVKIVDQVERIISLGVEKVAISSGVVDDPSIITRVAEVVGSQSVIVVMDVRKDGSDSKYKLWTHNGSRPTGISAVEFSQQVEIYGAGEVVINSIDRDGTMQGYDMDLVRSVRDVTNLPITVLGGGGSMNDIANLIQDFGAIGAAAGSLFVFKGKYRAVLISYPSREKKDTILL